MHQDQVEWERIYRIARLIVKTFTLDSGTMDDFVQEAVIHIADLVKQQHTAIPEQSEDFYRWCTIVVRNKMLELLRSANYKFRPTDHLMDDISEEEVPDHRSHEYHKTSEYLFLDPQYEQFEETDEFVYQLSRLAPHLHKSQLEVIEAAIKYQTVSPTELSTVLGKRPNAISSQFQVIRNAYKTHIIK